MPQEKDEKIPLLYDLQKTLEFLLLAIALLAYPYRMMFFDPFSFGFSAIGMICLCGSVFVFPLFVQFNPPTTGLGAMAAHYLWLYLIAMTIFAGIVSKRRGNRAHPEDIGQPHFGTLGGIALPFIAGAIAWHHAPGITWYIGLGWVSHMIQLAMIELKFRMTGALARGGGHEGDKLGRYVD